jgi:heptosyltransferase-1
MRRILIVKLTSLGDIIKALPVVEDIRRELPDTAIDWVVERPADALLALHDGIDRIIPLELRRYRKERRYGAALQAAWRDLDGLRAHRYDCIVELQGRSKSAIVAALARGPVIGPEPAASAEAAHRHLYHQRIERRHFEGRDAIAMNRILAARALGYPLPTQAPGFGLRPGPRSADWPAPSGPLAILVHGSSKPEKTLPEAVWVELGRWLSARGLCCLLPWGDTAEQVRARRLADQIGSAALVPERMPSLPEWVGILAAASVVAGVDSGITHLAAASGAPTLALFTATQSSIFRIEARTPHRNLGDIGVPIGVDDIRLALADLLDGRPEPA